MFFNCVLDVLTKMHTNARNMPRTNCVFQTYQIRYHHEAKEIIFLSKRRERLYDEI